MFTISKGKLLCLAACLIWALPLAAQQPPRAEILTGHRIGVTPPMANYLATHHPAPNAPLRVFPLRKPTSHPGKGGGNGGGSTWTDPVLQTNDNALGSSYTGSAQFDGISADGYVPPDTNISVGGTYIVETVNVNYAIYDRSGNPLQGYPAPIHSIFAAATNGLPSNSMCTSVDGGDPIVLYDKIDQRWIISQLAYNMGLSNNHFCLAISTTSEPTGSYAAYDFSFGKNLPDYPKLGIWATGSLSTPGTKHSGVYFSANIFSHGNTFVGARMCGFPLSDVATPPLTLSMTCYQNSSSVFSVLPADLEGSPYATSGTTNPAPSGTAEYFMQFSGTNTLNLFQFTPDFAAGTATVTTLPPITVAQFQEACGGGACVPQYNTSTQLDSLGDRLMYRLSYRNYGATTGQSMVVTQSVQDSPASTQTGVRWYQLTNTGNGWGVAQQGTFGPSDGEYRWMGSIAQDKVGDIGIGYSVSSSNMYPNLAFTGRTTGDASGLLEPETFLNVSNGSQTSVNRWGDYSSMSVDPTNDCTMWYANEFLKSTGSYTNWGTHITSFKFNNCN